MSAYNPAEQQNLAAIFPKWPKMPTSALVWPTSALANCYTKKIS